MALTALLYHLLFWVFESLPYYWELFPSVQVVVAFLVISVLDFQFA